tara:strand:- start:3421 stop:4752 length:1332 start_codon:yes stop_codon:yes gene_type:complete
MSWNDPKVIKAVDSLTEAQPISFKFINPEVQLGPVIGAFIENDLAMSGQALLHFFTAFTTIGPQGVDLSKTTKEQLLQIAAARRADFLTLADTSRATRLFLLYGYYIKALVRLSSLSSDKKVSMPFLTLQKLGVFNSRTWLADPPVLPYSPFSRQNPIAYARLKHSIGHFPFWIDSTAPTSGYTGYTGSAFNNYLYLLATMESTSGISNVASAGTGIYTMEENNVRILIVKNKSYITNNTNDANKVRLDFNPHFTLYWNEIYLKKPQPVDARDCLNISFEVLKTEWNESAHPSRIIQSPLKYLQEQGMVSSSGMSTQKALKEEINSWERYYISSIINNLQYRMWKIYDTEGTDLRFLPESVVRLGLKILTDSFFIDPNVFRLSAASGSGLKDSTSIVPGRGFVNAESADVEIHGMFTSLVLDPDTRHYVEERYYRLRKEQSKR